MKKSTLLCLLAGGAALYFFARRKGGLSGLGAVDCATACAAIGGGIQPYGLSTACVDKAGNVHSLPDCTLAAPSSGDQAPFSGRAKDLKAAQKAMQAIAARAQAALNDPQAAQKYGSEGIANIQNLLAAATQTAQALQSSNATNSDYSAAVALEQEAKAVSVGSSAVAQEFVPGPSPMQQIFGPGGTEPDTVSGPVIEATSPETPITVSSPAALQLPKSWSNWIVNAVGSAVSAVDAKLAAGVANSIGNVLSDARLQSVINNLMAVSTPDQAYAYWNTGDGALLQAGRALQVNAMSVMPSALRDDIGQAIQAVNDLKYNPPSSGDTSYGKQKILAATQALQHDTQILRSLAQTAQASLVAAHSGVHGLEGLAAVGSNAFAVGRRHVAALKAIVNLLEAGKKRAPHLAVKAAKVQAKHRLKGLMALEASICGMGDYV